MRDYWLTQYILAGVGWGYLILTLGAIGLCLWLVKGKVAKTVAELLVLGLASILPWQGYEEYRRQQHVAAEFKARQAKAQTLFEQRCKTAGEKIYRTVEGVEGVLLMKLRPESITDFSQYDSDDQYGYNVGGDEYIRYYLIGSASPGLRYMYVETEEPSGKFRYTTPLGGVESRQMWTRGGGVVPIQRIPIEIFKTRYAIEWSDISTREDRDVWIAGGSIRIFDRTNGQLLAERIGYLIDTGQGSQAGARAPWPWARYQGPSCPSVKEHNRVFVEKVLKPNKETEK